jgi:hypothetical protein
MVLILQAQAREDCGEFSTASKLLNLQRVNKTATFRF